MCKQKICTRNTARVLVLYSNVEGFLLYERAICTDTPPHPTPTPTPHSVDRIAWQRRRVSSVWACILHRTLTCHPTKTLGIMAQIPQTDDQKTAQIAYECTCEVKTLTVLSKLVWKNKKQKVQTYVSCPASPGFLSMGLNFLFFCFGWSAKKCPKTTFLF